MVFRRTGYIYQYICQGLNTPGSPDMPSHQTWSYQLFHITPWTHTYTHLVYAETIGRSLRRITQLSLTVDMAIRIVLHIAAVVRWTHKIRETSVSYTTRGISHTRGKYPINAFPLTILDKEVHSIGTQPTCCTSYEHRLWTVSTMRGPTVCLKHVKMA